MAGFDDRFEQNASSLDRWRPSYPAALYARLLEFGGGARFGAALDVGCGAGQSTDGLFAIAESVTGLEPGDDLRAHAAERFPHAEFHGGTGEATGLPEDAFDLFAVGTALTWMETPRVLDEAARVLRPGGVFAAYAYDFPRLEGRADEVLRRHLPERWDEHRSPRLRSPENVASLLDAHRALRDARTLRVENVIPMPLDAFVGFVRSTSFGSAYLRTLEEPEAYLATFRDELAAEAGERLAVDFEITAHVARNH